MIYQNEVLMASPIPNQGGENTSSSSSLREHQAGGLSGSETFLSVARPLEVYTWGRGEDGQLGVGDTSDQVRG